MIQSKAKTRPTPAPERWRGARRGLSPPRGFARAARLSKQAEPYENKTRFAYLWAEHLCARSPERPKGAGSTSRLSRTKTKPASLTCGPSIFVHVRQSDRRERVRRRERGLRPRGGPQQAGGVREGDEVPFASERPQGEPARGTKSPSRASGASVSFCRACRRATR